MLFLGHLGECGRLFSLDQDEDARQNSLDDPRFTFVHSNFRFLKNFMRYYGVERVDGILADLGVSFHHFLVYLYPQSLKQLSQFLFFLLPIDIRPHYLQQSLRRFYGSR